MLERGRARESWGLPQSKSQVARLGDPIRDLAVFSTSRWVFVIFLAFFWVARCFFQQQLRPQQQPIKQPPAQTSQGLPNFSLLRRTATTIPPASQLSAAATVQKETDRRSGLRMPPTYLNIYSSSRHKILMSSATIHPQMHP